MNEDTKIKSEYFECQCYYPGHTLRMTYFPYKDKGVVVQSHQFRDPPELYAEMLLCSYKNVFQRIWTAFKYILRTGTERRGDFDCCILKIEDCERLRKMLDRMIEEDKAYEEDSKKDREARKDNGDMIIQK
jgi:hypothetical protein